MACRGVITIGAEGSAQATAVLTVAGTTSVRWRVHIRDVTDPVSTFVFNVHDETPNSATTVATLYLVADRSEARLGYYPDDATSVDTHDTSDLDFEAGVWAEVQIDADGTAHAKLWQDGASVPGAWDMEGDVDATTGGVQSTLDTFKLYTGGVDGSTDVLAIRVWVDEVELEGIFAPIADDTDWTALSTDDITWTSSVTGDSTVEIVCTAAVPGVWIDFDGDGFDAGDYDNVSADTMSWVIHRGASPQITGGGQPGTATITLKNPDNLYNPYNEAGPLYGLLRDGLSVWIGVTDEGYLSGGTGVNGLFGGRVTDITPVPAAGAGSATPTAEITCEDFVSWARRLPVRLDYVEGRSHGALRQAALDAAGETRYDLASETATMPLSHADGDLASVLGEINGVNGTRHFAKPSDIRDEVFWYTTRNRQYGLAGASVASLDAGAEHVTGSSGWRQSADAVINRQRATVTPVVFTPATFTVWQAETLPILLDEAHPFSIVVDFDDFVAGAALDLASTGDTVISVFEPFATGAKIDLTVGAGDAATVTALSIEGRLARRLPAVGYQADDTTSQAAPRGIREGGEISGEYVGVIASAKGISEHVVWRYGNPQLRPGLTVENWFPTMFQLDLFEIIDFTSAQLAMAARLFEVVDLVLEGKRAVVDGPVHHVARYVVQESRVQTPTTWFTWDVSDWDDAASPWPY